MKKLYIETYGCQMNVADSEVVAAVMQSAGYEQCAAPEDADAVLINTCAVRDNAEQRVIHRLEALQSLRSGGRRVVIGVLGCMAERRKEELLSGHGVDIVAGPDAYMQLPELMAEAEAGHKAIDVELRPAETYDKVSPMRLAQQRIGGFVSITRGCNNFCHYCIVPYTRGRERSRSPQSILNEVRDLAEKGYKEVTLLGQNVNSYSYEVQSEECGVKRYDYSQEQKKAQNSALEAQNIALEGNHTSSLCTQNSKLESNHTSSLCTQNSKLESNHTSSLDTLNSKLESNHTSSLDTQNSSLPVDFPHLLRLVARAVPQMRVRFTTSHPKDMSDETLRVIAEEPNVCRQIHLPVQSGSNDVLRRMNRKYTREWYLDRVAAIRRIVPDCGLTTDIFVGYSGESEDDHRLTLDLVREVGFDSAFMFKYSERPGTYASRHLPDDVPEDVKLRRLQELIELQTEMSAERNRQDVGRTFSVLIEGRSKRSADQVCGRTEQGKMVVLDKGNLRTGDTALVRITDSTSATLFGEQIVE